MRRLPVLSPVPTEVVQRAYQRADALLERDRRETETNRGPIPCAAGCSACCERYVLMLDVEVPALVGAVRALAPDVRAHVLERVRAWQGAMDAAGIDRRIVTDGSIEGWPYIPCPLLDVERGLCRVYPARPIACRGHMVIDEGRGAEPCGERDDGAPLIVEPLATLVDFYKRVLADRVLLAGSRPAKTTTLLIPEMLAEAWPLVEGTMPWGLWLKQIRRRIPHRATITRCGRCGAWGELLDRDDGKRRDVQCRCPSCGNTWTTNRHARVRSAAQP